VRLRAYLVVLVLAGILPVVALAAVLVVRVSQEQRAAVERGLAETARALALAVDREVAAATTTLQALAASPPLRTDDLRRFHAHAVQVHAEANGAWTEIALLDAAGAPLLSTSAPFGSALPAGGEPEYVRRARETGQPAVSDLLGSPPQALENVIAVPVLRGGAVRYVLAATVPARTWADLLARVPLPAGWAARLLDSRRVPVARAPVGEGEQFLGVPPTPELVAALRASEQGWVRVRVRTGATVYAVSTRTGPSGWTVTLAIPAALVDGPLLRSLALVAGGALGLVAVGSGVALLLARRIARPVAALARAAEAAARGEVPALASTGLREVDDVAARLAEAAATRARAEALARQIDARLATTLRSIGDGVIATDAEGRVTFLNGMAEALTGWSSADAIGEPVDAVFRIVNQDTRQPVESPVTHVRRSGAVVGLANHTLLISRDGAERPVDDSAAPIRTEAGELVGIVLVFRDVTERRQAEEAGARLAAIVRWSDDAIVSKDLGGTIRSWNPAAERLFGHTGAEAVGQPITLIIPPERHSEEDEVLRRLRRGETVHHFETVRVRKDGRRIDVSLTSSPVRNADGAIIGVSKIARDITDRKRAERERAALLERERAARAEAEAVSRAKDEFLAMLSHELRNPLGAIASAAAVLERTDLAGDGWRAAQAVIARQVGHLNRLVDDLLDVARVTSGKIRLSQRPADLGRLVERGLEALASAGRLARHEVRVGVEPAWVEADEARIEQVLTNLVENAVKFTPEGGTIRVSVRQEAGAAVLEVADTGRGIPAELLPRVFDLFTQGEPAPDRAQGGLGLGLTLVHRLATLHGGTVTAASEGPGLGATFTVRLPAIEAPKDEPGDAGARAGAGRRRILLIEDNADGREMLETMLTLEGHEVDQAPDGLTGFDKAIAGRPDVVVVDIGLPGLDGYTVARRIRASSGEPRPRLVALTGYGQPEDRQRAIQAGFDAYLVKPVTPDALRDALAADG
jgi:PAS domain S-box-containing protein